MSRFGHEKTRFHHMNLKTQKNLEDPRNSQKYVDDDKTQSRRRTKERRKEASSG